MELGARTATILATAQLRHTGASATAIARVADVHRLSPGATQATANCLCGTGASFDWAGIINLGYDMATADRFEVSIMRRALKKIFGGQALCGGSCPEMMSSMGQIGTTCAARAQPLQRSALEPMSRTPPPQHISWLRLWVHVHAHVLCM